MYFLCIDVCSVLIQHLLLLYIPHTFPIYSFYFHCCTIRSASSLHSTCLNLLSLLIKLPSCNQVVSDCFWNIKLTYLLNCHNDRLVLISAALELCSAFLKSKPTYSSRLSLVKSYFQQLSLCKALCQLAFRYNDSPFPVSLGKYSQHFYMHWWSWKSLANSIQCPSVCIMYSLILSWLHAVCL